MTLFNRADAARMAAVASVSLFALPTWAQTADPKPADPPKPAEVKAVEPTKPVETPATPEEMAEGKKRLEATIKAHGGETFQNLKTLKLTGKGDLQAPPGSGADGQTFPVDTFYIYSSAPDKSRMEINTAVFSATFVNYGNNEGGYQEIGGSLTPSKPNETSAFDPTQTLRLAIARNYAVRAVEEKGADGKPLAGADGKPYVSFQITNEKGSKSTVSTNEAGLVQRIAGRGPQGGESVTTFGEYKTFDGVQLPTKMSVRTQGVELLKITFSAAEINKAIDDKLYAKQSG